MEGDPRLFQTGLFGLSISRIDVWHDHHRANGAFEVSFGLGCEDPIVLETAHMKVFKTRGRIYYGYLGVYSWALYFWKPPDPTPHPTAAGRLWI